MKTYKFNLPIEMKFEDLASEIVPNYDEVSAETQENTLSAFAITYTCFGGPYFTIPNCPETT